MKTILVVDDNEDLRLIVKFMLKGFNVIEAKDGEKAVESFLKNKPDLVLMDIVMPEMDGIIATTKILKEEPEAKILAITAYSARSSEILNAGAKEVLKKPVRRTNLIKKVNEYLNQD